MMCLWMYSAHTERQMVLLSFNLSFLLRPACWYHACFFQFWLLPSVSSRPMGKALCGVFTPSSGPCWCKPWRNSTSRIHMLSALLRPPLLGINTGLIIWQMQNSAIYQGSRNNACLLLIRISEVYSVNCHKKTFPVQTALLNIVGGI